MIYGASEYPVIMKKYVPFLVTLLITFLLNALLHKTLFIDTEMWAEAGTNYFYNAHEKSFLENLWIGDYGYLPWIPRFVALAFEWAKAPVQDLAFLYQCVAMGFIAICCSLFSLPAFSVIIESAFLRALISVSLALNIDYELKTFINMPYFVAIPMALYFFYFGKLFPKPISITKSMMAFFTGALFFLSLCSKALFLATTPVFFLIFIWSVYKKDLLNFLITALTLAGAGVQIFFIAQNKKEAAESVNPALLLGQIGIYALLQSMGIWVYTFTGLILRVVPALSLLALPASLYYLTKILKKWYRDQNFEKLWILFCGISVSAASAVIIFIGTKPTLSTVPFGSYHIRTWFIPVTMMYLGVCFLLFDFVKKKESKAILKAFFIFNIFTGSFSLAARAYAFVKPPTPTHVLFSDWKRFSPLITTSPEFYCVPLNPYPWNFGKNCSALTIPDATMATFPEESIQTPKDLVLGKENIDKKIQTFGILYKNIELNGTPELEIFDTDNLEKPSVVLPAKNFEQNNNVLFFVSDKPLLNVQFIRLKNVSKISHNAGQMLYVLMGK